MMIMKEPLFSVPISNFLLRRVTLVWLMLSLVLFLIPAVFGLLMRSIQAQIPGISAQYFYHFLTSHGLLMVGIWFTTSLALLSFAFSSYVSPNPLLIIIAIALIVVGALMSLWAVFIGDMATGWYFLYPLPLRLGTVTGRVMFFAAIGVLGVGWLLWCIALLLAVAQRYTLREALGWHYIAKETAPNVPPMIMIAGVSLVAVIICLLMAVILLLLFALEFLSTASNDALLMKNLVFVFGHTLVNMNLYLVIALVYEYFPKYGGGEFKNSRMLAIVWNSVLCIVLFAYFHHLYMDFAQPSVIQYVGQFASYGAGLMAATFTIFSVLAFVMTHRMEWSFSSIATFTAIAMWTIGGIAAVIDATIPVNFKMHNTLWVPAHFHSYYFTGAVMMMLAFMWTIAMEVSGRTEQTWIRRVVLPLLFIGGGGFVLMFYLSGMQSVPRRYALYPALLGHGTALSYVAVVFILIFLLAYLVLAGVLITRMIRGLRR